ncbi:hypothetical protein J1605_003244 [Eschrichtius robustus]|uniref:Eukaryotic translation initiation factor 2 subunit 2 n=1 Tax=Eschrichtius robustus TaxID=9764 RepID=A0AB34HT51_ESCRO|nr:hypothetical protein J1605_003244 [Eschrichtius robustus]
MQDPSAVVGEVSAGATLKPGPGADLSDFPSVPSPLEPQPCPGTRVAALRPASSRGRRFRNGEHVESLSRRGLNARLMPQLNEIGAGGPCILFDLTMIFDPTMSKKKKKKKKPFMLDEEGDAQTEETQPSETKEMEPEPTEDKDVEADEEDSRKKDASDDLDDLNFFNQKKKKKKTKKIFDIDEAEEGVKDLKIESDVQEPAEPEDDLDIMLGNKKKKKKNVKFPDEDEILEKDEALEDEDSKKDDGISFSNQTGPAWAGSERDYTYEELLNRVFNIMREKNPDMVAGEKRKFVMKPPQVVRVGTKKTSFVNFTDICKL